MAAWWGVAGSRTPSLWVGGVELTDHFGKQLGVLYWSVGAPPSQQLLSGHLPWGPVGSRGHESSGLAPPSRVLVPSPWPPAGNVPALGPAKAGAEQAELPQRGRCQPPGGPGLRGPWGGRVSRSQGSPDGVFLLAPQVQQDVCLPGACGSGAGLSPRGLQAEEQCLKHA